MVDTTEYNPDLPHTGEDRAHAIPIPVVSANEAVQRRLSGDYSPAMLDTQARGTAAPVAPTGASQEPPPERKGWAVSNDEANAIMGARQPLLPPSDKVEQGSPGWLDYTASAARQNNLAGAAYDRFVNHPDSSAPDVPGYSPYDNHQIAGYEDYATKFADSNSPQQTQVIKERIDQERQDKQIIGQAGAAGWATSMFFGVTDPTTLALMFVPGLGEAKTAGVLARAARGAVGAAAAGEVQQYALTRLQTTTDYTDNMIPRLATDALLGGTLGALIRGKVPKAEFDDLASKADAAVNGVPKTEFFHSSPHVFDEFDASKLGTGEGNQSFGIGKAYVATSESVAKHYANIAESKGLPNNLYRGEIKTSDANKMLDMDKPLTEQPHILEALGVDPSAPPKLNGVDPKWTGSELYDNMRQGRTNLGVTDKAGFSDLLESKGVTGIKYLDAQSRAAGDGSSNMVIFKNTEANLTHRNGEAIGEQTVPSESTGGAAAVRGTSLEDESFAKGGAWLAKADATLPRWLASPTMRVMSSSPVVESRRLVQRIVDLGGGMLNKNKRGIATPTSVEMVTNQIVNSREAQIFRGVDDLFAEHAKEAGQNALNKHDFGAEILKALSNGDKHEIPQVAKAAKVVRPFFDADHTMLQKIAPDADYAMFQKTAESYAPRVYDLNKITADRTNFERFLFDHFKNNPKLEPVEEAKVKTEGEKEPKTQEGVGPPKPIFRDAAEIKAAVQDTIDNIQHAVRGTADVGTGVRNPKSAKARVLDASDNALRPWLSDDFEGTIKAYMRTMVPHIEMHRQFGSVTLETELQQISDAYRVKMAAAGADDAAKAKLVKQRESDMQDLMLMRDRTLGQAGPKNNESLAVVRAAQIARSVNYVRSLGAQLFSAIPDLGRVVARYGMTDTVKRISDFALNSEARDLAKTDMQRMGTALDVVLHTREHSLEGTGSMVPTGDRLNAFAQNATAKFTKLSMIAHWDASIRLLSAQLEQDAMARLVKGENVSAFEKAKLAAHGIGEEDLAAIREQWNTHGSDEGGLNRARTELWTDQDAAGKVEQAIQRAASTNAFFIGKGDVPGFADSQMGKFLFQFKGFVMGSVERLALPLAQGIAHGDVKAANGLAMMLSLGGLRYYLKERAAGRQPDMSPQSLGPEMLQASGVLAFLPDIIDPLASLVHLPRFSKFKDHGWSEIAFGPTAGMLPILGKLVEDASGAKFTAQDMHKVRQLVPYQNMFYLNRLFNMVEGKTSDALNLKNATHRPAVDYLNPVKDTDALEPEASKDHFLGINAIPNKM
jgi:hypothetical protein